MTTPATELYYFAYGSNMSVEQMNKRRVEGASRFLGRNVIVNPAIAKGVAIVSNYELNFNKINRSDPNTHFASISPKTDSIVEGVLYLLDKNFIEILDGYEGVKINQYTRESVQVTLLKTNEVFTAYVYIAHPQVSIPSNCKGTPTKNYLNTVLRGATEAGLSKETITRLTNWPTAPEKT